MNTTEPPPVITAPTREAHIQQHAQIIALRTTIAQAEEALSDMKAADLTSRKRAARAEGQLEQLRSEYDAQERAHTTAVNTAAGRIRSLEAETSKGNHTGDVERSRLVARVEKLRLDLRNSGALKDAAVGEKDAAESRAQLVEGELLGLQKAHAVEKRALLAERDDAKRREAVLQKELDQLRASRRSSGAAESAEVTRLNSLVATVQEESLALRSELEYVNSKSQRCETDLRSAEEANSQLRSQVRSKENSDGEVSKLRKAVAELQVKDSKAEDFSRRFEALSQEKKQLCELVASLSDNRDVQDGLSVLRKICAGGVEKVRQILDANSGESPPADFGAGVLKVLHFDDNPLDHARAAWLLNQNKKDGRKRMRVAGSPLRDGASKEEIESVKQEMEEFKLEKEDLKRRALMGDRTRAVALKRIEEIRSAVYNLFGWSMKVNGTLYMLSSIYAESPNEVLHFCVNETGTMSLVDCEYAQSLGKELEQYVYRMNSFPALLSHVTMENFEKTTAFIS